MDFENFARDFDQKDFNRMLGIRLLESAPDYGRICLAKTDTTPQGIGGSVHGGVLATMVDVAMLVAVFSNMKAGSEPAGTADLNITYLRQAHGDNIFADARVIKRGRQLASVEVDITDDEGTLCARGRVLYAFRYKGESVKV